MVANVSLYSAALANFLTTEAAPVAKWGETEGGIGRLAAELSAEKAGLGGEK